MKNGLLFWLILLLVSCKEKENKSLAKFEKSAANINYARNFIINNWDGGKEIILLNPKNEEDTLASYLLVKEDIPESFNRKKYDRIVQIPVKNIVITSSTTIGMISVLGLQKKVKGINISDKVFDKELQNRIDKGIVKIIGDGVNINDEVLLSLSPEIVVIPIFLKDKINYGNNEGHNISFILNMDWLEKTPLARAEWIKYIAAFFDKGEIADSVFYEIEKKYLVLKNIEDSLRIRPKILAGAKFKDVWYTPGGQSYMAQFFMDAGGDYFWHSDSTTGSIPLSFEIILEKQMDAEIWILPENEDNRDELLKKEPDYKKFRAFQENRVYSYHKMVAENGANAWWEQAIVQPDIVLKDMIAVFHPEQFPDYETQYLKRLQ